MTTVEVHNLIPIVSNSEATDSKESACLTKSLFETTPINLAMVKTEPDPEPLASLDAHNSHRTGV